MRFVAIGKHGKWDRITHLQTDAHGRIVWIRGLITWQGVKEYPIGAHRGYCDLSEITIEIYDEDKPDEPMLRFPADKVGNK